MGKSEVLWACVLGKLPIRAAGIGLLAGCLALRGRREGGEEKSLRGSRKSKSSVTGGQKVTPDYGMSCGRLGQAWGGVNR